MELDHIIPHKGDPVLFWDEKNWQVSAGHITQPRQQEKMAGSDTPGGDEISGHLKRKPLGCTSFSMSKMEEKKGEKYAWKTKKTYRFKNPSRRKKAVQVE
jgi:hypothetical protein